MTRGSEHWPRWRRAQDPSLRGVDTLRVIDGSMKAHWYSPQVPMPIASLVLGRAGEGKTKALILRAEESAADGKTVLFVTFDPCGDNLNSRVASHGRIHHWRPTPLTNLFTEVTREALAHAADVVLLDDIDVLPTDMEHGVRVSTFFRFASLYALHGMTGAKVMATASLRDLPEGLRGTHVDQVILDERAFPDE